MFPGGMSQSSTGGWVCLVKPVGPKPARAVRAKLKLQGQGLTQRLALYSSLLPTP